MSGVTRSQLLVVSVILWGHEWGHEWGHQVTATGGLCYSVGK